MNNVFSIRYGVNAARSFRIKLPAIENALSDFADVIGIPNRTLAILPNFGKSVSFVFQNSKIESTLQVALPNRFSSSDRVVPDLNDFTCFVNRVAISDVDGFVDTSDEFRCIVSALSMSIRRFRMAVSMTSSLDVPEKYIHNS